MSSRNFWNSLLSRLVFHSAGEKEEIFEIRFYVIKKFSKFRKFYLVIMLEKRKGRNFRSSILRRQEIRIYLIIEL